MTQNFDSFPIDDEKSHAADNKYSASISSRRNIVRGAISALVEHRWFAVCATVCAAAFASVITGGTGQFIARETFSDFYDYQAVSILNGRLDVPLEAIRNEAFIFNGKYFGYFGPTPAMFRIPFVLMGACFGELSRFFMVVYFSAALVAAYLLLLHAVRLVRGDGIRPMAMSVALFVMSAGLGSTLFFLSSRAYIYHEAILCGAAFALWGVWCALRHLETPSGRWWIGSIACGLLSLHARPPTGLFSLATMVVVALTLAWRELRQARVSALPLGWKAPWRHVLLAVFAVLAVLSFNALSYLKFETIDGCPLRFNVQYDDMRLAKIEGRQFHLTNLIPNTRAYLLRAGFTVKNYFPYLITTAPIAPPLPAKIDLFEPMVGVPFAMPALTILATAGSVAAAAKARRARPAIVAIWVGAAPPIVAILAAVNLSHRYTADFCPFLIGAGGFGIAAFKPTPSSRWRFVAGAFAAVVALNILIVLALTLHYQGIGVWGVSPQIRRNYAAVREKWDAFLGHSNPAVYSTDRLSCEADDATFALYIPMRLAKEPATFSRALELCDEALRDNQDTALIFYAAAIQIYAKSVKTAPKAIECLERAFQLKLNILLAHHTLADLLAGVGRIPEAIEQYKLELNVNPQSAVTHNNLGAAYYKLGRFSEALSAFANAQQIDPRYSANFEWLKAQLTTRP